MKRNHPVSVRSKLVDGDTPGPAGCRQFGVVAIGNFVNQLELAKASCVFHRWNLYTDVRQLQQKLWPGMGFGIKLRSRLHGEHSGLTRGDQGEQQPSSRYGSAHSVAGENPEKLRSVGSAVNARLLSALRLVKVR